MCVTYHAKKMCVIKCVRYHAKKLDSFFSIFSHRQSVQQGFHRRKGAERPAGARKLRQGKAIGERHNVQQGYDLDGKAGGGQGQGHRRRAERPAGARKLRQGKAIGFQQGYQLTAKGQGKAIGEGQNVQQGRGNCGRARPSISSRATI